jgi:glycerol-3-phosphate acyltransferase PlsY
MFGTGMLLMLAFWVLVIGGIVWLVVTLARGSQGQALSSAGRSLPTSNETPLDIFCAAFLQITCNKGAEPPC